MKPHHLLRNGLTLVALALGLAEWTEPGLRKIIRESYRLVKGYVPNETSIEEDPDGVPWVNYGQFQGQWVGRRRNPVTVCQRAFEHEQAWRAGQTAARSKFFNCATWLLEHAVVRDELAFYEYSNPWYYNLTPPWRSAMANGQALQVLVRAHQRTGDERFLSLARQLLAALQTPVECGGLCYQAEEGWWFEEYVCADGTQPRVLNGMIFTWLGIREYQQYTADPAAEVLLDQGLRALQARLPDYARPGGYSVYDALGQPAGDYHAIHVDLLDQLHRLTGEPIFGRYRDLWATYRGRSTERFAVRLFKRPGGMNLAVLGANLLLGAGLMALGRRICRRRGGR